jgi:hypothetical protein
VYSRVVTVALLAAAIAAAQNSQHCFSDSGEDADRLKAVIGERYIHGVSFKAARTVGSDRDVLTLTCLLRDPQQSLYWSNIAVTLGMGKNPRATGALIDFIQRGEGTLTWPRFNDKLVAVVSLGYLAGTDQAALQFLLAHTDPKSWSDMKIGWLPPGDPGPEGRSQELSKSAVQALGLSGNAEAERRLTVLQSVAPGSDWASITKEALRTNKFIHDYGLAAYFEQSDLARK